MPEHLIEVLVPISLALITFGIGISITGTQIREIWVKPKAFLVALTSQMVALPLIAFVIAFAIDAPPYIKVGLVVLAASPGGSTSGFLTYLFRGNTALSITLTSVNALLTLVSIPIVVNLALSTFMGSSAPIYLPFWRTMQEIFTVTLLPAGLGIWVQSRFPKTANKIAPNLKPFMMVLLGLVFGMMFFGETAEGKPRISSEEFWQILPYCVMLNLACMLEGFLLPGLFRLGYANQVTTSIESGVHNTTLAFLITISILGNADLAKPVLVYAILSFWSAVVFIYAARLICGQGSLGEDLSYLKKLILGAGRQKK